MFTEGLNPDALRWVKEGNRIDSVTTAHGRGLPPVSKFRSGHLPIHVSRTTTHNDANDCTKSWSDMDTDDSDEEEVYRGRYSLNSSPPENIITPISATSTRYGYDGMYSDARSRKGNSGYTVREQRVMEVEDESSDSAGTSEFSSTQVGSNKHSTMYGSEGYASTVPSRFNAESTVEKNLHSRNRKNGKSSNDDDDAPSAPPCASPLDDSTQEIGQSFENFSASGITTLPHIIEDFSRRNKSATTNAEATASSSSVAARPTFHASALGPWYSVIAYESCFRLCLHAWSEGCMEAPIFMENECALLREAFGLQHVLLQSEDELMAKHCSKHVSEGSVPKPKKIIGKLKVQVRKVKMSLDPPSGCNISNIKVPVIKMESIRYGVFNLKTMVSRLKVPRINCVPPRLPSKSSFTRQHLAHTSSRYLKQVSGLLKNGVSTLRNNSSSYEVVQETYSCSLRLKSSTEKNIIRMQPGSGETHVFFPDSLGDDLIVEVQDSTGKQNGRVLAQVATIAEDPGDKLRWWSIYREPEHELIGKIQLYINYSTSYDENNHLKCGSVAETVAYDLLLEVVLKVQHFQQRNLKLHGHWSWLLTKFAKYYGVSDIYTRLRYLSYIMDVATPTADCLSLVYDQLLPVVMKGKSLSHQENRIFGEIKDQLEHILAVLFENYKSLDESSMSGVMEVFKSATRLAAPALEPGVKLYTLLHDILSPEAQTSLCSYLQTAAKKRSRRHLADTDEYVSNSTEGSLIDAVTISTAYQKMKSACVNIKDEILMDIDIHDQHILPSFIDLPNLLSSIYSTELCNRLRAFLISCPPPGPIPFVAELVIASSDFQRDLTSWNICPIKGGVDAKELFHLYIILWIQDKRLSLLESCKLDKIKWSGVRTQHSTTPFVDDMYERLKETLNDYEIIICRWPEYSFMLENAVADIEKAIVDALDKQYADVLSPLKENLAPKIFGLQYMQKLAKRSSTCSYVVPDEIGVLLNSMKRMLDVLRPKIETQFKSWGSCIPDAGNNAPGERLSEVTVMLRTKFRNYIQAIVEKLADNTKSHNSTKLKKILKESKENLVELDVRSRMQALKEQLRNTINQLHTIFGTHVFILLCRGYWDRMGLDVLSFLENRKENQSWYKGARVAVSVLNDIFASQMQQLLGNSLQEQDIEPPRSITEVRAILCKDAPDHQDNRYYY